MKTIAIAAIAGLAAAASAQDFSLTITPSTTMVDTTSGPASFTMTVFGDASVGSHLLGGAFGLTGNGDTGVVQNMVWSPAAWSQFNTDNGYAGNGSYNTVVYGQLVIPGIFPPAPNSELGQAIGSFEVTVDGMGDIDFQLTAGSPFTLEVVDSVSGDTFQSADGTLSLGNSGVISVVPAPSAMALLGLGGLVAGRRRR